LLYFPLINFGGLSAIVTPGELRPGVRVIRAISELMATGGWSVKAGGRFASVADKLVVIDPQVVKGFQVKIFDVL